MKRTALAALAVLLLGGCDGPWSEGSDRIESAREFPPADRPVAPITSTKWSTEEARDRVASEHRADAPRQQTEQRVGTQRRPDQTARAQVDLEQGQAGPEDCGPEARSRSPIDATQPSASIWSSACSGPLGAGRLRPVS